MINIIDIMTNILKFIMIHSVFNKKYDIQFDLKFDSFYNFIDSLKESKKYYYELCKKENINITDFDNEYVNNINIIKGELLKYYILIINDNDIEQYIIINEIIKDLYNFMFSEILGSRYNIFRQFNHRNIDIHMNDITESAIYIIKNININYLTRNQLSNLINIYAYNSQRNEYFTKKDFLSKMNISTELIFKYYHNPEIDPPIDINDHIQIQKYQELSSSKTNNNFDKSINNYLDSLSYKRELDKILNHLPNMCISNIF